MRQNVASTISCKRENALFDGKDILSNFKTVEKHLEIESSEIIFENMTNANLQNAAEMFLYLNSCPNVLKPWILFYTDLFTNYSPDKIVLTLNRILKIHDTASNKNFKNVTRNLFQRIEYVLELKYKDIQKIINGKGNGNLSWIGGIQKL